MATAKKKVKPPTDKIASLTNLLAADAALPSRSSKPLSGGDAYDRSSWKDLQGAAKKPIKKLSGVERMYKGSNKGIDKRKDKDAMMRLDGSAGRGYDQRMEEEAARKALEAKAKKYNARNFTEEELLNSNVDFAAKEWDDGQDEGSSSDSSESPSASVPAPRHSRTQDVSLPTSFGGRATNQPAPDVPKYGEAVREEEEWATYEDEFSRERQGEVRWLRREGYEENEDGVWRKVVERRHDPQKEGGFAYTTSGKDLQEESSAQYGEQSSFPVYEPSEEYLARLADRHAGSTPSNATNAAGETHFDPGVEKRTRNAAAYGFSRDEDDRRREMERLKRAHEETERKRAERASATGTREDSTAHGVKLEGDEEKKVVLTEAERAKMERKRMLETKKEELARKRAKKVAPEPASTPAGGLSLKKEDTSA